MEVVIERKSLWQMQLVNQHLTGTVCKTPRFIGKLAEGLPTQQNVGLCEVVNSSKCSMKELLAYDHSASYLSTRLQESQCLIDDVVRSDQRLGVLTQPTSSRSVISI